MGLLSAPRTRDTTYTAATPVKSNDLDDIQDALIQDWTDVRGVRRLSIPLGRHNCEIETPNSGSIVYTQLASLGYPTVELGTAGDSLWLPLPFKPGDTLLSFRIAYTGSAGPTPHLRFPIDGGGAGGLPYSVGITLDSSFGIVTDTGVSIEQWNVTDANNTLWVRNPTPGTPNPLTWARNATLSILANANNTTFYSVDFLYSSTTPFEAT